ncbi:MAG TPA: hypothetical protein VD838_10860 [Anaeromyxobacteraceae bacterium]|nr:hypothetical protein [Anaeromyxobacteraceae bacterium]
MPPRLGDILVQDGACTPQAIRDALQNQVIFGGRLGTNLLELGTVTEEALARALGRRYGVPSLWGDLHVDPRASALIRREVADRHDVVPYLLADRKVAVLCVDPSNLGMLDEVAFATGRAVHAIVVPEARLWALLREVYGVERQLRGIEVDFGRMGPSTAAPARAGDVRPVADDPLAGDLIDERAFTALYANARPPEEDEILELTDADFLPAPTPPPAAPVAAPAPVAATPPPQPEPSPLGFAEALRFLEGVEDRNAIANTVLRYARSKFRRSLLLTVNRGVAAGWAGLGDGLAPERVRAIRLALGGPGILDTVVGTRAHFLGPIPKTEANVRLLRALGGGVPANAFVVPILALGRVVNLFYADNGRGGVLDAGDLGELLILSTRIAQSYAALVARAG